MDVLRALGAVDLRAGDGRGGLVGQFQHADGERAVDKLAHVDLALIVRTRFDLGEVERFGDAHEVAEFHRRAVVGQRVLRLGV